MESDGSVNGAAKSASSRSSRGHSKGYSKREVDEMMTQMRHMQFEHMKQWNEEFIKMVQEENDKRKREDEERMVHLENQLKEK